uniref:Uncharacterized protein n=1 Tax=Catharus ustulatus TaxID=91951 RepID=A0A8C3UB01_CATUS
ERCQFPAGASQIPEACHGSDEVAHLAPVGSPALLLLCLCGMVGTGLCSGSSASTATGTPSPSVSSPWPWLTSPSCSPSPSPWGDFLSLRASDTSWARDRAVTAGLNVSILLAFPAGIYSVTAFSAVTALFVLSVSCWPCHRSQRFPVLLCALFWLLSFLLTVTLYFHPSALTALVLSCLCSVLTLTCSGLSLLPRLLCCSWKQPPRQLCALLLLSVVSLPFFTAHFGYWPLLRAFDFSVFALSTSLPLTCANSKEFPFSVGVAFQRAFEDMPESGNRDNSVESPSMGSS